jgi:hypothetical protein
MAWRRISWQVCKGGARACHSLVNTLLAGLALLGAAIIASIHLIGTVPLPGLIVDLLEREFAREGLVVDWEGAWFDLTGRILVEGLACHEAASGHPILRAEAVQLDLDLSGILLGSLLSIEQLQLRDAALYLPPELAIDAGAAASLHLDEFRARLRGGVVHLGKVLLRTGEITLETEGPVPLSLAAEPAGDVSARAVDQWRSLGRRLGPVLAPLQALPPLDGRLQFRLDAGESWLASARLRLDALELAGARVREVLVEVPEVSLAGRALDLPMTFSAGAVVLPGDPSTALENVTGWIRGAPLLHPAGWRVPGQLTLYGRLSHPGLPPVAASARLALAALPDHLEGTLRLVPPGGRLDLATSLATATRAGTLTFTWQGDPDPLLGAPRLAGLGLAEEVRFSAHTTLGARIRWDAGGAAPRGTFHLVAFGSGVREADFDEARATGWFDPHRLQVGPIEAFDPGGQWARGHYLQSFETSDFRIVAEGNILPRRLDSLLPSFYRELWEDIDPGPWPTRADVDVLSRWGAPDTTTARVHARGRDLAYNGVPVDTLELHLWQATGFVDLLRLRTRSPQGWLEGSVGLTFAPAAQPEIPRLRLLDLEAELALEALAVVFGEEVAEVAEWVGFTRPPRLRIEGLVSLEAEGRSHKDLRIQVDTSEPWRLLEVPFDRLSAVLTLNGPNVRFDPLVAGVGEGRWSLMGDLVRPPATEPGEAGPSFALETSLEGFPFDTLWQLGQQFGEEAEGGRPASPGDAPRRGRVDLTLAAQAEAKFWETLEAEGAFTIADAPLGRIHLLGGLSRVLSSAGLNLATLQLDRAQSTLRFSNQRLELPDLEVRSPTVRIELPGTIRFPGQELDFAAKVFFLDTEAITPLDLLATVLRPLGYALELEVSGVLGEPQWRFVHNPLNLLRPRPRESESEAAPRPPPAPEPGEPPR